ncbi:hypothetical protein Dsin_002615 [Dipteronia sinensis]|uniref:Transposase MuDR plant domain-containing protein n=1 Tax=Dipteronia sinensis TaxID=43782 RepID=A0AAE0B7U7_9ROSI|nr:hypothetical protein Dsin_002615 [Dipteronia sinensis]
MSRFQTCVKFLGSQYEYIIGDPDKYTLDRLWCDMYMLSCSTFPKFIEQFKAEVKLPWNDQYLVVEDDVHLQQIFSMFRGKSIDIMRVDVELVPLASFPLANTAQYEPPNASFSFSNIRTPAHKTLSNEVVDISSDEEVYINADTEASEADVYSEDDEEYNPYENGLLYSEETKYGAHSEDLIDLNFSDDIDGGAANNSGNDSDDDSLSDAASFIWDNDLMVDGSIEVENSENKPATSTSMIPFRPDAVGKVNLAVGQLFHNLHHFRQVIRDFAVQKGFQLRRIKNERDRYTSECEYKGCGWRIHASPVDDRTTFMIKTLESQHTYQNVHKNQEANAVWVAKRFNALIEANPDIEVKLLHTEIHRIYEVSLPVWTLYRAKHRVLDKAENQNCKSYNKLHNYGHIIKKRNPSSLAYLQTITPVPGGPTLFQRFFLSFTAQKDGFLYDCMPFIGLDACHLKGKFSGLLMSAVGLDANNGVFPIALCVAEWESKQSWGWFLEQLYLHIGLEETRRVTFMSDRQKMRVRCGPEAVADGN